MADGPLRLGLIGAGRWGRVYIKTLDRLDGVTLARVATSNPDSRALVAGTCVLNGNWRAVAGAGFDIVQSRYFDTIGVAPRWLLDTMMGATGFNPLLVGIYDAVFAPLSRGIESLVPPPFGKNVLLVARRPES